MRIKAAAIIIIIGFIVAVTFHFIAIAANDTPHNSSNNIGCGSCHGEGLLKSFWGGSGIYSTYDELCLSCHTEPFGPYLDMKGPFVKTHSDAGESALAECRNCHNPHYQRQKVYKNTDAGNLYLATGKIQSCVYSGKDPLTSKDISTFYYSDNPPITYKSGWEWNPPTNTKLVAKTGNYRGAILFPNVNKLGYSYQITAVDPVAKTITVNGNLTTECSNNYFSSTTFAVMYGQYIKDFMYVSGTNKAVKFFDKAGAKSFADGDTTYDGVCEVCHTQTKYHKNDGSGASHYATMNCISCHPHTGGFVHGGGGGTGCDSCHGHSGSHYRHTDVDPPATACSDCHNTSSYPGFNDGKSLSETTVCDTCHSPSGAFNGVSDAVIGAKPNWPQGAYESGTYPTALRAGKEKWCAGCHDNVPSVVNGTTAPDIVGNNSTYGYYLDTHGNVTYGVSCKNVTYSKGECLHCHDVSQSGHGGKLFDITDNFCFKCHDNTTTYATTVIKNRSYSYRAGNYNTDSMDDILEAFSLSSKHKLSDIKTFINGKWGYTASSNPCDACHNPHIAQGDPVNSPDSAKSPSTRGYPVVRPSEHATNYNNLWGDISTERMSNYTVNYQAPYRYNSITTYEPDGSTTQNGSNLTDFNTFCTDCHNTTYTIYSTTLGRNLKKIDWNVELHGKGEFGGILYPQNPYNGGGTVLSCTDCHEPHGSPNVFLLRKEVNGAVLDNPITAFSLNLCTFPDPNRDKVLGWLCKRCHKDDHDQNPSIYPDANTWKQSHHYNDPIKPYKRTKCNCCHESATGQPIACNCCHYHGSHSTDYGATHPCYKCTGVCTDVCNDPCDRRTF